MTDKQYQVLVELFNEYNEAFVALPLHIKQAFYGRLYAK